MIIETEQEFSSFIEDNKTGDWIVHVISLNDDKHPCDTVPILICIFNIKTKKYYYLSLNHPDSYVDKSLIDKFVSFILKKGNKKWTIDKKYLLHFFNIKNLIDINLVYFLNQGEIFSYESYLSSTHIVLKHRNLNTSNKIIPLMKHMESFELFVEEGQNVIEQYKLDSGLLEINNRIIPTLTEIERSGIYVDVDKFKTRYKKVPNKNGLVYSQYNIYTNTGRPSNRFDNINYSAISKKDHSRECFISRFGDDGRIVVIDYVSFHPRIICYLTNYELDIKTNIYEYLAKLYFHKSKIDDIDVSNAKLLTFKQLYGGVEEKYKHIKYLSNLKSYIDEQWEFFIKNEYVLTPIFKRKITKLHVPEPSATKVFNYLLQALEGEIALSQVQKVLNLLKKGKSKIILYTYDSIICDFHRDDGIEMLNEIKSIMSWDNKFPITTFIGKSYQDVK